MDADKELEIVELRFIPTICVPPFDPCSSVAPSSIKAGPASAAGTRVLVPAYTLYRCSMLLNQ